MDVAKKGIPLHELGQVVDSTRPRLPRLSLRIGVSGMAPARLTFKLPGLQSGGPDWHELLGDGALLLLLGGTFCY